MRVQCADPSCMLRPGAALGWLWMGASVDPTGRLVYDGNQVWRKAADEWRIFEVQFQHNIRTSCEGLQKILLATLLL